MDVAASGFPGHPPRHRHQPLPATTWRDIVTSGQAADADLTPEQREARALATTLADELIDADAILLAIPLYNWGIAAHVKSWYDITYTDARIKSGALAGKPVVLASVLGGDYRPESGKAHWDHSTPWLRHVIENIWKADLLVVQRQLTLVGREPGDGCPGGPSRGGPRRRGAARDRARAPPRRQAGRPGRAGLRRARVWS